MNAAATSPNVRAEGDGGRREVVPDRSRLDAVASVALALTERERTELLRILEKSVPRQGAVSASAPVIPLPEDLSECALAQALRSDDLKKKMAALNAAVHAGRFMIPRKTVRRARLFGLLGASDSPTNEVDLPELRERFGDGNVRYVLAEDIGCYADNQLHVGHHGCWVYISGAIYHHIRSSDATSSLYPAALRKARMVLDFLLEAALTKESALFSKVVRVDSLNEECLRSLK